MYIIACYQQRVVVVISVTSQRMFIDALYRSQTALEYKHRISQEIIFTLCGTWEITM